MVTQQDIWKEQEDATEKQCLYWQKKIELIEIEKVTANVKQEIADIAREYWKLKRDQLTQGYEKGL
jgi:hypothetical protein